MKTITIFVLGLLIGGASVMTFHYSNEKELKIWVAKELLKTDFKTLQQLDKKNYLGLRLALIQGMNATVKKYKETGMQDEEVAKLALEINDHLEMQKTLKNLGDSLETTEKL